MKKNFLKFLLVIILSFVCRVDDVKSTTDTINSIPTTDKFYLDGDKVTTNKNKGKPISTLQNSNFKSEGWSLETEDSKITVSGYAFVRKPQTRHSDRDKDDFYDNGMKEPNTYWLVVSTEEGLGGDVFVSAPVTGTGGDGGNSLAGYYCTQTKKDEAETRSITWSQLLRLHYTSPKKDPYGDELCSNGKAWANNPSPKDRINNVIFNLSIDLSSVDLTSNILDGGSSIYLYILVRINDEGGKFFIKNLYFPKNTIKIGNNSIFSDSESNKPTSIKFSTSVDTMKNYYGAFAFNQNTKFSSNTTYNVASSSSAIATFPLEQRNNSYVGADSIYTGTKPYRIAVYKSGNSGTIVWAYMGWTSTDGLTKLIYYGKQNKCTDKSACIGGNCENTYDSSSCTYPYEPATIESSCQDSSYDQCVTSDNIQSSCTNTTKYDYYYKISSDKITGNDGKTEFQLCGSNYVKDNNNYYVKIKFSSNVKYNINRKVTLEYDKNVIAGRKFSFNLNYNTNISWDYTDYNISDSTTSFTSKNNTYINEIDSVIFIDGMCTGSLYIRLKPDDMLYKKNGNSYNPIKYSDVYKQVVDDNMKDVTINSNLNNNTVTFDDSNDATSKLSNSSAGIFTKKTDSITGSWTQGECKTLKYEYKLKDAYINADGNIQYSDNELTGYTKTVPDTDTNKYYFTPFINADVPSQQFQFEIDFNHQILGSEFKMNNVICEVTTNNKLDELSYRTIDINNPFPKGYADNWNQYRNLYNDLSRITNSFSAISYQTQRLNHSNADISALSNEYKSYSSFDDMYKIDDQNSGNNRIIDTYSSIFLDKNSVLGKKINSTNFSSGNHCQIGYWNKECDKMQGGT